MFKVKENLDGRLVAEEYYHQVWFDFSETFRPVVKLVTIMPILTIALTHGWLTRQADVNNVFFQWIITRSVHWIACKFVSPNTAHLLCKLQCALHLFGFITEIFDQSLFHRKTQLHTTLEVVYVDDILITSSNSSVVTQLIVDLNHCFALKDLGELHFFLGELPFFIGDN